jgi:hypothetical protein
MAFFEDLSRYTYGLDADTDDGALNVGWLDGRFAFPRGPTSLEFRSALRLLCSKPIRLHRGFHRCDYCLPAHEVRGNGQIRVRGMTGQWYAAPTMIHHYVSVHFYLPPSEFMEAVIEPMEVATE